MSTRSVTSCSSGVPRPFGPTKPTAWESSTITSASCRSARSQIPARSAMWPSIENTPSVAIIRGVGAGRLLEARAELVEVAVRVAQPLRLAEPDPVDDRGVVERVGDDGVVGAEQRLEQAAVRVEARAEEDRVLGAEELREALLELLVERLRAADEAHRGHAEAPPLERLARRLDHGRMVGEPEVVVGAEVEQAAHSLDLDVRGLRRLEHELALVEARLLQPVELPGRAPPAAIRTRLPSLARDRSSRVSPCRSRPRRRPRIPPRSRGGRTGG